MLESRAFKHFYRRARMIAYSREKNAISPAIRRLN